MAHDTVVMPAVRISRKLWKSLENIMRRRMFNGKTELIRDALREYALRHGKTTPELRLSEAALTLREGRAEDQRREEKLIEWVRKVRS